MSRTFASLSYPNYRLWFLGTTLASTAVWMQRVAQDWVVLTELTNNNDATAVGITTALQFLPQLLFAAYAGVWVDRMDLKRLIQVAQVAMAMVSVFTAVLLFEDLAQLWHFYVLAFLGGCIQALDSSARQIFVNQLVPARSVPNAVALNSAAFNIARLIGPAVAGFALAHLGSWVVFVMNAVLLFGPVIMLALMNSQTLLPRGLQPRGKGQLREGLSYLRGRPDIILITLVASMVSALGLNFQLTSAVMARVEFHRGAGEFGLLGTFMAVGSVFGAVVAARRALPRVRTVVSAAFAFGIVEGVLALSPNYYVFALVSVPLGYCSLTMLTAANSAIQISSDPRVRGRIMSIYMMLFLGTTPVGAPLVGWISNTWGPRWGIGVGSLGVLVTAIVAMLWVWSHWDVDVSMRRRWPFVDVVTPRDVSLREHPEYVGEEQPILFEQVIAKRASSASNNKPRRKGLLRKPKLDK